VCRFCWVDLPSPDLQLRKAACFDFTIYVDAYINQEHPSRNTCGFHAYGNKDSLAGFCANATPDVDLQECSFRALAAAFRFILHFYNKEHDVRTFQIVHRWPTAVRLIKSKRVQSFDKISAEARELFRSIPPCVWISWDAGRGKKVDRHFAELRKRLRPDVT
jgi:hypothetical protein